MSEPRQNPPQGGSAITPYESAHYHTYQIAATDMVIVRWCPSCGKTWTIQSNVYREFSKTWKVVEEPLS